ncbi:hypothetical protein NLI96_g10079 [Meripilus lineatus]|uniref:J domain-containing protein n=1 Tax=Meripilus lineatus TaxID=2056292 RepID=A0AAD5UUA5_9APHY|nr:hypothetical protein NLI96_g10079 [Physisporinus lineatus]
MSPADYLLYYKRGTAYFSLGRHPAALSDFDRVLSLTSDSFDNAYLMKARIHAMDGRFPAARDAIKRFSSRVKSDPSLHEILMSVTEGEIAAKKANQAKRARLWTACVEAASTALAVASYSTELRQLRIDCALASTDIESAVGDLTRLTHLITPSTDLFMKIFRLSYFFLPYSNTASPALATLKQCLHYDPDSKQCLPAHRLVKSFDKTFKSLELALSEENWTHVIQILVGGSPETGFVFKFDDALSIHTSTKVLPMPAGLPPLSPRKTSPKRELILRSLCKAYTNTKDFRKAESWCDDLLRMDGLENDVDGLIGKGETLLKKEEWEDAVRIFEKAFEASGRSSRDAHQRLQKAQKLLKQSRQKDYYKVLGVSRDADSKTIKRAFRKAAMSAHPDKGGSEAKMASVNEAYEVLSNSELRQRFDNGDDPNDPTAQQGGYPFPAGGFGGAHPFAQFFQQSGGGFPGNFQFQFNHGRR